MRDGWFKLTSGRDVLLHQFHARSSELEFLEGRPDLIRAEVLRKMPKQVSERYGHTGFLLREPPPGRLPAYTFFADLPVSSRFMPVRIVRPWLSVGLAIVCQKVSGARSLHS